MRKLTGEISFMFAFVGAIFGILLAAYTVSEIDSLSMNKNSQYVQQYWAELKDLTVHHDVEVTYINPKVYSLFSLTPYFVADVNLSKAELNTDLLKVGWRYTEDYYVKESNGIRLKLSTQEIKQGIRIRLYKLD